MNKVEEKVAEDLRSQGYSVYGIEPTCYLFNKAAHSEEKSLMSCISDEVGSLKFRKGSPDLLVYSAEKLDSFEYDVKEAFFVEVKSENDALDNEQLHWISKRGKGKVKDADVFIAKVIQGDITYYKISVSKTEVSA